VRRTRDTEIRREGHIPGAVDEISQSVVSLLRADRARHGEDHQPGRSCPSTPPENTEYLSLPVVRPCDDDSRGRVQNVRGDSSVVQVTAEAFDILEKVTTRRRMCPESCGKRKWRNRLLT